MKKYKLLKDLPDLTAGAIFYSCENIMGIVFYRANDKHNRYNASEVENNPEWFEEVKEIEDREEYLELIIKSYQSIVDKLLEVIRQYGGKEDICDVCTKNYIEKDKIRELIVKYRAGELEKIFIMPELEELIK